MKKMFKKYLWLFEFIGAAIIIAVGIVTKVYPDILVMIIGIAFLVMGVFRIIPLVKTTENKKLKIIYAIEMIINIFAGIALIYLSNSKKSSDLNNIFGYIIGGILYLRALVYFVTTSFYNEKNDLPKFICHIILITVGSIIIGRRGFDVKTLGWVILAFSILCFGVIGFDGYRHYRNYRHEIAALKITERVKEEKGIEVPTSDEVNNEIINEKDHNQPTINA